MPVLAYDLPSPNLLNKKGRTSYQADFLRTLEGHDGVSLTLRCVQDFCFAHWAASRGVQMFLHFGDGGEMNYYRGEARVHKPSSLLHKLLHSLRPTALLTQGPWLPKGLEISTVEVGSCDMVELVSLKPDHVTVRSPLSARQCDILFHHVHHVDICVGKETIREILRYNRTGVVTQLTLRQDQPTSLKLVEHYMRGEVKLHRLNVVIMDDVPEARKQLLFNRADELGMVLNLS